MQITFNTPQEETDWQDFCERLSQYFAGQIATAKDYSEMSTPIELLREMQERGMTFE